MPCLETIIRNMYLKEDHMSGKTVIVMGKKGVVANKTGSDGITTNDEIYNIRFEDGSISTHPVRDMQMIGESVEAEEDKKVTCPKCDGEGCEHCDGKGYHLESVELDEKVMGAAYPKGHPMRKFETPASPELKKWIESGKAKIIVDGISVLGPTTRFVVVQNPKWFGGDKHDPVLMFTISDPKRGRIKMFSFHGSHVSHQNAMKFAKNNKLVEKEDAKGNPLYAKESVELDEDYKEMMKWYEKSDEKKVYDILKKNKFNLPADSFTLVQNTLKKNKNVNNAASMIMNRYPQFKTESVEHLDEMQPHGMFGSFGGQKKKSTLPSRPTRIAVSKEFDKVTRSGKMDTMAAKKHLEKKFKITDVRIEKDKNGKAHVTYFQESVELDEAPKADMRKTGSEMLRMMPKDLKSKIEKGQLKVVDSAPSWLGGKSEFQVLQYQPVSGPSIGGQRDPYIMVIVSNPEHKPMKIFSYYGTHPSRKALMFAKNNKLLESVDLDEAIQRVVLGEAKAKLPMYDDALVLSPHASREVVIFNNTDPDGQSKENAWWVWQIKNALSDPAASTARRGIYDITTTKDKKFLLKDGSDSDAQKLLKKFLSKGYTEIHPLGGQKKKSTRPSRPTRAAAKKQTESVELGEAGRYSYGKAGDSPSGMKISKGREMYLKSKAQDARPMQFPGAMSGGKMKGKFTSAQLKQLKDAYAKIGRVDPSSKAYEKLTAFLDAQDKNVLQQLANARIQFISSLALNRVNRLKMKGS